MLQLFLYYLASCCLMKVLVGTWWRSLFPLGDLVLLVQTSQGILLILKKKITLMNTFLLINVQNSILSPSNPFLRHKCTFRTRSKEYWLRSIFISILMKIDDVIMPSIATEYCVLKYLRNRFGSLPEGVTRWLCFPFV